MNQLAYKVIVQLSTMLIIALLSFVSSRFMKFTKNDETFVSKLLLYFINPCLILSHFNISFDSLKFKGFLFVFVVSIIMHLVMIGISLLTMHSKDDGFDRLDRIATVFTNCGFIGIPLISGVLGEESVFYLLGFIVVFNIFFWTFGFIMMGGSLHLNKILTNPNIISLIIGMILFVSPFTLPSIIALPLSMIGNMNSVFSMILLGLLFANFSLKSGCNLCSYIGRIIKLSFVRLVLMAFISFGVLFLINKAFNIPDSKFLLSIVYIASLCPVGLSVSSFAVLFNKDESYSALLVMVTSVLCIFTLPLSVLLLQYL